MRTLLSLLAAALLGGPLARGVESLPRILLYTRNGLTLEGKKGYVHDNIPDSVAMVRKLGAENGFAVDVSDDPAAFTDANLKKYRALVFSNTNNQIFDTEDQRGALQRYIRGGGGFAGIHSACGSMRAWPWFWAMAGGSFVRHPKLQEFTIQVVDRKHPSTSGFAETFRWTDEFYFLRDMPPGLHVLLVGDLSTLNDSQKPVNETTRPLAWCHSFEGGRCWFTTLGHRKEAYADPIFQKHILGGIRWAMGATTK
ncbi:MAG: ThuA domain-containing protein [Verrucomicrobia bacterium]|nr:ThuA domain-containing protein [Verrucomicrobiota bacterium]